MEESTKIKKNSIFSTLSITSRLIANVIVFWILARFFNPELFGQFTFAHTLANTFIIFADFGFDILLTTEIARRRENASKIFQQLFSLKLMFTLLSMLGMWVFAYLFELSSTSHDMILVFSVFLVFTTLTNFLYALYKGFEILEYETKVSLIMNVGLLIIVGILLIIKAGILSIAVGFVFSRFIGFLVGVKYSYKVLPKINYKLIFDGFTSIKSKMFVFGFHFLFSYLFFQLDTILLAMFKGDYYVGIYQSVFKLVLLPLVIPEILVNVLLPVLSRLNFDNTFRWEKLGSLMSKLLFIVIIPIALSLSLYSEKIIKLIYGSNYNDAIPVLKIFAMILVIRFILEPFALMLTTSNRQKYRMYVVIAATFLNLILNIFFIPQYGVVGAASVSLITNAFVALCYLFSLIELFKKWIINFNIISISIGSIILFYVMQKLPFFEYFIGVPIIFIIYLLTALTFFFSPEEKRILFSLDFVANYFYKRRGNNK